MSDVQIAQAAVGVMIILLGLVIALKMLGGGIR